MSFRARTAENVRQGRLDRGPILEIDGVTFGPNMKRYDGDKGHGNSKLVDASGHAFGAPTPAMLASDTLIVRTLTDLPWPGSSEDRHGKGVCQNGMANALAGASSPFGDWPDTIERRAQSNTRFAREQPEEYAERVMAQRPYREDEKARVRGKAAALAAGMDTERFATDGLDVERLPPVSKPKSDETEQPKSGEGGKRRAG